MSGKFHYELDPVLLSRKWELDAGMLDLGRTNASLQALQRDLDHLEGECRRIANEWNERSGAGMTVDRFAVMTHYMHDLTRQCLAKQEGITEKQQERDRLIDRVTASQRSLESVEKHRDKAKGEFVRKRLSDEFKAFDDHWSVLQARMTRNDDES